jgi:hypothetical protein
MLPSSVSVPTSILMVALAATLYASPTRPQGRVLTTEHSVPQHATGDFDVKLAPLSTDEPTLGRLSIDKQFHGDLQGTSKGEMLAASTAVNGSAGYVAMERVTGALAGRSGSFVLQHSGTMNRGAATLSVSVVPDSGTGELQGIAGSMTIDMSGGGHRYELTYTLPAHG